MSDLIEGSGDEASNCGTLAELALEAWLATSKRGVTVRKADIDVTGQQSILRIF